VSETHPPDVARDEVPVICSNSFPFSSVAHPETIKAPKDSRNLSVDSGANRSTTAKTDNTWIQVGSPDVLKSRAVAQAFWTAAVFYRFWLWRTQDSLPTRTPDAFESPQLNEKLRQAALQGN
jgi:hypothetical protein